MTFKKLAVCAALAVSAIGAHAANWRPVAKDNTYSYYADVETATRSGDLARVWIGAKFVAGAKQRAFRMLREFNCTNGEWSQLSFYAIDPTSKFDHLYSKGFVEPDSIEIGMRDFACSKRTVVDKILNWF